MHVATRGFADAFAGTDFCMTEHGVDCIVRSFKDEGCIHVVLYKVSACGIFGIHIGHKRCVYHSASLEYHVKRKGFAFLQLISACALDGGLEEISSIDSLFGKRCMLLDEVRNIDGRCTLVGVLEHISFAHERFIDGGEDHSFHFDSSTEFTDASEHPVDFYQAGVLVLQRTAIHAHQRNDIGRKAVHEAGVGVVRYGAEQGEYQRTFQVKSSVGIDSPTENESHLFATHFDVVLVGKLFFFDFPLNSSFGVDFPRGRRISRQDCNA